MERVETVFRSARFAFHRPKRFAVIFREPIPEASYDVTIALYQLLEKEAKVEDAEQPEGE